MDEDWGTLVWLVMTTGLRRGEVCILRWSRVDLDAGEIEIRSSYRLRNGVGVEKDTKTHQMRRIALDTETVGLLRELKGRWWKRLDDLGLELTDDMYVFTGYRQPVPAVPYSPHDVSSRYKDMATRLGIDTQFTPCTIIPPQNYSAPESICAPSRAASATAGEGRPRCASTPPGSPPLTAKRRRSSALACLSAVTDSHRLAASETVATLPQTLHKSALKRPNRSDVHSRHKATYGSCCPRPVSVPRFGKASRSVVEDQRPKAGEGCSHRARQAWILGCLRTAAEMDKRVPLAHKGWSSRGGGFRDPEGRTPRHPPAHPRRTPSSSRHCQCHSPQQPRICARG